MTDIWSPKKRSEVMARIRKTDSGPEQALRRLLNRAGVRYTTYSDLPGTPDIIIEDLKLVIFVHGCFWHGCTHHYRPPLSNMEYWSAKLRRNKARDRTVARKIRAKGWHTMVIWECQVKRNPQKAINRLLRRLNAESTQNPKGIL